MLATADAVHEHELRVLDSLSAIDAVSDEWCDLEARCQTDLTFFQTFAWCRAWVEEFASGKRIQPHIRTVWRGDRLVAVWPLMFTRGALGVQTLETLGDPHSQYANMLCDPTEDPQALGATLIDGLQQNGNVDIALIRALPANSGLGGLLSQRSAIDAEANEAAILDLSQYVSSEAYTASLGKTQKRNRNRRRNHLARHGELLFEVLWPGDVDYRSYLSVCLEMKRRWLSETGRYSAGFALEGYEDFLARLEGNAEDLAGACLSVLKCGDRVVALELGFIRNRHYYAYIGGFDWDLGSHSPGKVQMDMTVCWLIDNGIVAYDLLGNAADYKQSWTNRTVPLVAHTIPFSLRGRIYAALWVRGLRPLAKRFYNRLPEAWRRLMVAGQTFGGLLIYV